MLTLRRERGMRRIFRLGIVLAGVFAPVTSGFAPDLGTAGGFKPSDPMRENLDPGD